jgi:urea carboxylase
MEGPGGYQLFGRTLQMWNTFKSAGNFEPGTPWLLRFFDQIRFYPVTAEELLEMRDSFPHGKYVVRTEEAEFSYRGYQAFLQSIEKEALASKLAKQQAFSEERARWAAAGQALVIDAAEDSDSEGLMGAEMPTGCTAVTCPLTASVWKILVDLGQNVEAGANLVCLEAMKTELMITSPVGGVVREIRCKAGALVTPGQILVLVAAL